MTIDGRPVAGSEAFLPIEVIRGGQSIRVKRCTALFEGDTVQGSIPNAAISIEFPKSIAVLRGMTSLTILDRAHDAGEGTGAIMSFFGEIFGFGRLKIQDEFVTAGAEGTRYVVRTFKEGKTTITVLEGHVRVDPKQSDSPERVLETGEELTVGMDGAHILGRITAAEVAAELAAYHLATGYSAAELLLLQSFFDWQEPSDHSLSLTLEGSKLIDSSPVGALSAQVAWSYAWFRPSLTRSAFKTRLLAGGIFGQYQSPMTDPATGREETPRDGTASLPFEGALAELDAELHLRTNRPLGYVFGAGIRGGFSHQRYVEGKSNHFVWGPVLTSRGQWRWGAGTSGLVQLSFLYQKVPVAACPIGCVELAEPRPPIWELWVAFALGVEVDL